MWRSVELSHRRRCPPTSLYAFGKSAYLETHVLNFPRNWGSAAGCGPGLAPGSGASDRDPRATKISKTNLQKEHMIPYPRATGENLHPERGLCAPGVKGGGMYVTCGPRVFRSPVEPDDGDVRLVRKRLKDVPNDQRSLLREGKYKARDESQPIGAHRTGTRARPHEAQLMAVY